jgi:hypothetical protein
MDASAMIKTNGIIMPDSPSLFAFPVQFIILKHLSSEPIPERLFRFEIKRTLWLARFSS